ncbi:MAG: hypothetical protein A2140_04405 [Candidatus Muproteobacteria bacterium RBG_16_62_13]|uniref:Transporter n=1 Tax=Candidatus Muproteobacteria bacterium RBG_16_62_13 TaxID=1817756 RepID=A0A1F6T855_9PROT|nr:MAG: hypothetical protein A2140_04405 [Candidatus Muproteobacteria bacterium RBG_16_62_13]
MLSAGPARADLSFTTGVDYTAGKYGAPEATRVIYVPFTFKYEGQRHALRLTVPYIRISAPVGGDIIAIGSDGQPIRSSTGLRETNDGLGDAVAAVGYTVFDAGASSGTLLDVTAKVKFATADEAKGLGTGENDYSLQLDLYQTINRFTALATAGYRVYGDPPDIELDEVFFGSLGGVFKFGPETSAGLIFDFRDNIVPRTDPQRDLTVFVMRKLDKRHKLQGYAARGLSDASPDWGAGLMFTVGF